jgi:hypothetical protein
MISDRDMIIGLYEAIGALARRTTGETLVVRIIDSDTGETFPMYTPSDRIRWLKDDAENLGMEAVLIGDREPSPAEVRLGRRLQKLAGEALANSSKIVALNNDSDDRLKAAEARIAALRTQLAKFAPGWQDAADALRADDDAARVSLLPPTDESKLAR